MAKPKLRFPEFTDEWEEKQLKDFMVFKNGLNADKDKFGSGIKFISVMDILNNPFITYDIIRGKVDVDEKTLDNYSVTYGDVLFQRSSETREDAGKSNVYLDKENVATFGGFIIRGKKTGDYSPKFMNSLLKSPKVRKEITSKAQGAQHINVGQETLENVNIVLPTVKEQEKIADFLSSVDDIIEEQKEKITALEEQKKGIMQKLFNREVRFKADDGSEYPEWEEKRIDEVCQIVGGGTPSTSNAEFWNGNIQWFTPTEVGKSKYVYTSERTITEKGIQESSAKLLPKGSILLSTRATIGEMSIAGQECCTNQGFQSLIVSEDCSNEYIYYLQYIIKAYALKNSSGSTFLEISKNNLGKCILPIPCIKEQKKIVGCLSTYDEAIQIKKDKLEVWKEIKKGLLQQMFV